MTEKLKESNSREVTYMRIMITVRPEVEDRLHEVAREAHRPIKHQLELIVQRALEASGTENQVASSDRQTVPLHPVKGGQ